MSLEQIRAFLERSEEIRFEGKNRKEVYDWLRQTLVGYQYHIQGKGDKGLLRDYVGKMTGLSRAQVTRLIGQYVDQGTIEEKSYRRRRFPRVYSRADIGLLAEVDEAHETLSGPATQKILYREYHEYGNREYERLSRISIAHLYNLRQTGTYRKRRVVYQATRPVAVSIGERRKPDPQGRPGYLRVDTVHQGDWEGTKGVYHVNAVDEVTQWEVLGAVEQISEAWLLPVLEDMLDQFPFRIQGFHSDNGSEFINHRVAELLNKLLAEQTKSRPRHSNDNGLAECKNGAVVRKHMGYGHIRSEHAEAIHEFYREHFNAYLNFHRPCGVPQVVSNAKGKQRRIYPWYATPWEILRQLPDVARYLKPELTAEELNERAARTSDTAAARRMQHEKQKLFASFKLCQLQAETTCMTNHKPKRAVEMTGYGKRGKPTAGFPRFPQPLEIAQRAIPTFPQPRRRPRGKVEIQKQDSHFPTAASRLPKTKTFRKEDSPERRVPRRSGSSFD